MSFDQYRNKEVTIKSTSQQGKIVEVLRKRGQGGISIRFLVVDQNGAQHELMPHEVKIAT